MFFIGVGVNRQFSNPYDPLAVDYFNRVVANGDTSLTPSQQNALNNKFIALRNAGYGTSNIDRLFAEQYCYTAIQALTPFIWNGLGNGLGVAVGSPTFTAGVGWTHNGSSYINTNYNPSINGSNYVLNNAGIYFNGNIDTSKAFGQFISGASDGTNIIYFNYSVSSNIFFGINTLSYNYSNTISSVTSVQDRRISSTQDKSIINSTSEHTQSANSSSIPNYNLYYGAVNAANIAQYSLANNAVTNFICYGNSSLDKSVLASALAS